MRFTKIKNIRYSHPSHIFINMLGTCEEYGEIPITLNIVDIEDIHTFVKEDGSEVGLEEYCLSQVIKEYKEIVLSEIEQQEKFREDRNSLLKDVDFYQLALVYSELTAKQKKELKAYRLALLDSTKTQILPTKPIWFK